MVWTMGWREKRRIWIGGLSICGVVIGVSRSLSMRHARKFFILNEGGPGDPPNCTCTLTEQQDAEIAQGGENGPA